MERHVENQTLEDISEKVIPLTGRQQVGKTTLSKMLLSDFDYLNYDNQEKRYFCYNLKAS